MAENIPAQRAMLMLWTMLTTGGDDIFKGVTAGGDITPIQNALAGITGLDDDLKSDMITAAVQPNNFAKFDAVRNLFQSFATLDDAGWPGALGPKHPAVAELDNIFQKA